jgi:hypothetical protein
MTYWNANPKPEKKIKEKYKGIKRTALEKKLKVKATGNNENSSVLELINELDGIMSEFIRLLSADRHGIVKCFTCPNKGHWEDMQNGHFVPRKNLSTRFNLQNQNVQCEWCNEKLHGNLSVYEVKLNEKYGADTAYELKMLGKIICKRPAYEYRELIETYTDCVSKLKANLIEQ